MRARCAMGRPAPLQVSKARGWAAYLTVWVAMLSLVACGLLLIATAFDNCGVRW